LDQMRCVESARLARVEAPLRQGPVLSAADVRAWDAEYGELREGERLEDRGVRLRDESLMESRGIRAPGVRKSACEKLERQRDRAVENGSGALFDEREQRFGEAVRNTLAVARDEGAVIDKQSAPFRAELGNA